jgi:hypothetical protein
MAKSTKSDLKLTASNLKNVLWDTLNQVKEGRMDAGAADSIATQAREIVRTTHLQLQVAKQSKRQIPMEIIDFSENNENGN